MNEPEEVFYLESIEDLRTIADTLRVRLFDHLVRQPLTVTQLAELVGETAAKIHYHVRELERIGVVRLVETREKGGVLEKYYRAVAKNITVTPDLLHGAPNDELAAMVNEYFQLVSRETLQALNIAVQHPDQHPSFTLSKQVLWATRDEYQAFMKQMAAATDAYNTPRGLEGEQEWVFNVISHPMIPSVPEMTTPAVPTPASQRSRRSIMVLIGDIHLSRADLEKSRGRWQTLRHYIIGAMSHR